MAGIFSHAAAGGFAESRDPCLSLISDPLAIKVREVEMRSDAVGGK
jgi:hypothetical protein